MKLILLHDKDKQCLTDCQRFEKVFVLTCHRQVHSFETCVLLQTLMLFQNFRR